MSPTKCSYIQFAQLPIYTVIISYMFRPFLFYRQRQNRYQR